MVVNNVENNQQIVPPPMFTISVVVDVVIFVVEIECVSNVIMNLRKQKESGVW